MLHYNKIVQQLITHNRILNTTKAVNNFSIIA